MDIEKIGNAHMPSVIKDPFNKDGVTSIRVVYSKGIFGKAWEARGTVEFENGNTTGEQTFRGADFDEVVLKIKAMLENLK